MESNTPGVSVLPIWGVFHLVLKVTPDSSDGGGHAAEEGRDHNPCKGFPLHHVGVKNLPLLVPVGTGAVRVWRQVQDKTGSEVQWKVFPS